MFVQGPHTRKQPTTINVRNERNPNNIEIYENNIDYAPVEFNMNEHEVDIGVADVRAQSNEQIRWGLSFQKQMKELCH